MKQYIKLIRPNNWIKNFIIILPVFFAGRLLSLGDDAFWNLGFTFIAFCLSSSMIYVINDMKDVEKDRLHPQKSKRPIASGAISKSSAYLIITILALLVLLTFFLLPVKVVYYVLAYIVINLFYCFGMKNFAILDVTSISLGFVFRVLGGGEATNTLTTHWIIILVFLLMFSVALAKRRDDLVLSHGSNEIYRQSQLGYSIQFIDIAKTISFTVTLVAYIIYSVSNDVIERIGSNYVYITSLPVFLGIMRYIQLTVVYKKSGSPVDLVLKDKFLITIILLWIFIFGIIIYV
ncbi:UbiA prenyltransferase family protein [Hydrotalea sandarakina]|jgi:4-hydroxybenzoate polyprenyltransferase|uniref:4-hydroxybenzoate polyprenyltransferase n=1 Tax=Hydrotalea sandarakina TaxID=1004304 RepID=A0A2W7RM98_9BACT|nr:UbiA prenyltransferase family protein [Hydrotalea sandarakina]PZX61933.1 4-hydroxybenzoate polyprenyltransferase [Hydrotalea sandarakina]